MIRLLLIAAVLPFFSGCVSNPGNYYSYEGGGDYYYEDAGADVYIDSYPMGYGLGYAGGPGYGFGWGYGGFGYGFGGYYGYGGYGPWGYGYAPIWWTPPTVIVVDSPSWRARAEDERAQRVALSHRPDAAYPESAAWARRGRLGPTGSHAGLASWGARRPDGRTPAGVVYRPPATAIQAPAVQPSRSAPAMSGTYSRESSGASPVRIAPAPRMSGRKQ